MANLPPSDSMPSSFDENVEYQATPMQKFARKLIREPLIPIGCTLTVAAFLSATRAIRKGDHHQAQRMFRARVLAQGFTILAIVGGGIYLADDRKKERQQWALERQQKQQAETQKWIRELEARDAEEKALQERIARRRELRKAGGSGGASQAEQDAAEAELEAQLAAAEAREAAAAARAAGSQSSGGGILAALGGMFGGGSSSSSSSSSKTPNSSTVAATAAAASEPELESAAAAAADAETDKEKPEPRKGVRKSHGRSQLDTLGDLFGKRGGGGGGGGADGEEKK